MFYCNECQPPLPKLFLEANGFIGTEKFDYKYFCEMLYITLYAEHDGFDNTALLLGELYNRSKIDGTEVALINDFGIFEVLLKSKMFSHVVGCERRGSDYSFRYYARLNKEFENLRRNIIPKCKSFGRSERI